MVLDLIQAGFNSFGDFDLALTRQEFDCAHFAHIHANRVSRPSEFGIDTGEGGFRFLGAIVISRCSIR